jgi:hypothetical protein
VLKIAFALVDDYDLQGISNSGSITKNNAWRQWKWKWWQWEKIRWHYLLGNNHLLDKVGEQEKTTLPGHIVLTPLICTCSRSRGHS